MTPFHLAGLRPRVLDALIEGAVGLRGVCRKARHCASECVRVCVRCLARVRSEEMAALC